MVMFGMMAVEGTVHDISVGKGAALAFEPSTLTADVGDT